MERATRPRLGRPWPSGRAIPERRGHCAQALCPSLVVSASGARRRIGQRLACAGAHDRSVRYSQFSMTLGGERAYTRTRMTVQAPVRCTRDNPMRTTDRAAIPAGRQQVLSLRLAALAGVRAPRNAARWAARGASHRRHPIPNNQCARVLQSLCGGAMRLWESPRCALFDPMHDPPRLEDKLDVRTGRRDGLAGAAS